MKRFVLEIPSDPEHLKTVRQKVQKALSSLPLCEKAQHQVVLAIDEACSNVIRHAYKGVCGKDKKIIIKIEVFSKKLKVKIRDFGKQVPPKEICGRKLTEIRPGGLGVHLIKCCVDEVFYNTQLKQGTELTLIKYLV